MGFYVFYFTGSGRIQVAQLLLRMLPLELASISEPEERATEYLHYRQFFNIWETLARIVECQALEVQVMSKDTRAAWIKDYTVSFQTMHFKGGGCVPVLMLNGCWQ